LITCKWASCAAAPFSSKESFTTHIETAHLLPFLWHAGDGPRNSSPSPSSQSPTTTPTTSTSSTPSITTPNLPKYLLNAEGKQVTPSIQDQQFENDDDRKKRQARINRVLQLRDENAPLEPDYTSREREIIGEVAAAKQARLRMYQEYADRLDRGGEEVRRWRGS
jgi:hypothetical protein